MPALCRMTRAEEPSCCKRLPFSSSHIAHSQHKLFCRITGCHCKEQKTTGKCCPIRISIAIAALLPLRGGREETWGRVFILGSFPGLILLKKQAEGHHNVAISPGAHPCLLTNLTASQYGQWFGNCRNLPFLWRRQSRV